MKIFLIIVIAVVVLLLGALGFVVVDKRINGSEPSGGDTPAESSRTDKDDIGKDTDKDALKDTVSGIDSVLADRLCSGETAGVTAENFVVVDDTETFKYEKGVNRIDKALGFAYVQYECGSQVGIALMKRSKEDWSLVSSDPRIYPLCDSVRNRGFPASVIGSCYESISSKEPIAL